ncbi:hypothetical protein [Streptomyces sp. NPDC057690]|uniref:hypothetical protein n=1 Tax=Streptomyces sp. NPDC057690 TaxID=3346214 RepID=UPI003674B00F
MGIDAVLVPVHARPRGLEHIVRGLRRVDNLDGMFVTVPHRGAVRRPADRCGTTVDMVGSANMLRREAAARGHRAPHGIHMLDGQLGSHQVFFGLN